MKQLLEILKMEFFGGFASSSGKTIGIHVSKLKGCASVGIGQSSK
jgi:hypothetical protein